MSLVAVIGVELAVVVVATAWFIAVYALRPWLRDPVGRQLMALSAATGCEALTLLLVLLGFRLPLWVFAVIYGLVDAVVIHRLVLLYWARRGGGRPGPREPGRG